MISIIYQSVLSNLFGFIGPILDVGIKEMIEIINKFVYGYIQKIKSEPSKCTEWIEL